jgi:uncharacterized protein
MQPMEERPNPPPRRWKKIALRILLGMMVYLALEAFVPARWQPSARISVGLIRVYQKIGSPVVGALGGRCRYEPTCSHYAEDAIAHYGTLPGAIRTMGRLWRCSPWGGGGYDPAV